MMDEDESERENLLILFHRLDEVDSTFIYDEFIKKSVFVFD